MKCVFSIMDNDSGKKIYNEMIKWLRPNYEVMECWHDWSQFEFPGINMAMNYSLQSNEPVLYIHSKGAGNHNECQPIIRKGWKKELTTNKDKYIEAIKQHDVVTMITGNEKHTWFNSFMATPKAFKAIESMLKEPNPNRYFYEDMWLNTDIDVYGVLSNDINHYNVQEIGKYIKV